MMVKWILMILLFISIAYWSGYIVRKIEDDRRPVCFIKYDDAEKKFGKDIFFYVGSFEAPSTNWRDELIAIQSKEGLEMYFLVSKNILLTQTAGKPFTIVVNVMQYSRRKDMRYVSKIYDQGITYRLNGNFDSLDNP